MYIPFISRLYPFTNLKDGWDSKTIRLPFLYHPWDWLIYQHLLPYKSTIHVKVHIPYMDPVGFVSNMSTPWLLQNIHVQFEIDHLWYRPVWVLKWSRMNRRVHEKLGNIFGFRVLKDEQPSRFRSLCSPSLATRPAACLVETRRSWGGNTDYERQFLQHKFL